MRVPYILAIFFMMALFSAPARAATEELVLPDFSYTPPLIPTECMVKDDVNDPQQCQRLDHGAENVLFLERGLCRWMDNTSVNDYMVPFNTQNELDHFFTMAPDNSVTVDICCASTRKVVGTLANGSTVAVTTPIGRSYSVIGATTAFNHVQKEFAVAVAQTGDCTTTQTVDVTAACDGGGWNIAAKINAPHGCTPPPPSVCITKKPVDLAIVVDASASMQSLVDSVKASVKTIVDHYLAGHNNISLTVTVLGGKNYTPALMAGKSCPIGLLYGPNIANASIITGALAKVTATQSTPLAAAIAFTGNYLRADYNPAMIVLSDGYETCDGDVNRAVLDQKARGVTMLGVMYSTGGGYASGSHRSGSSSTSPVPDADSFKNFDSTAPASSQQDVLAVLGQFINQSIACNVAE